MPRVCPGSLPLPPSSGLSHVDSWLVFFSASGQASVCEQKQVKGEPLLGSCCRIIRNLEITRCWQTGKAKPLPRCLLMLFIEQWCSSGSRLTASRCSASRRFARTAQAGLLYRTPTLHSEDLRFDLLILPQDPQVQLVLSLLHCL